MGNVDTLRLPISDTLNAEESANAGHTALEAVTKDQLNINLTGQLQHALPAYLRNVRLDLYSKARHVVLNRKD